MKMIKGFRTGSAAFMVGAALLCMPASSKAQPLTDAEIASVAVTANQVDINAAELAKTQTTNKDILNFVNSMINDHKAVIDQAVSLVTRLKVTPKENAASKKLLADAEKTKKMLLTKSGKASTKTISTMK